MTTNKLSPRATSALNQSSIDLRIALLVGGLVGAAFLIQNFLVYRVNPVPIVGVHSLARPSLIFVGIAVFGLCLWDYRRRAAEFLNTGRFWLIFNTVVLSFATAILAEILLVVFVIAMGEAFKGLALDIITATLITIGATAMVAYMTLRFTASITISRIYNMLITILFGGILISAITFSKPNWYGAYLSALGMQSAGWVAVLFNFSLTFAGIMMIALASVLCNIVRDFYVSHPRVGPTRFRVLFWIFIAAGVFLAGIGFFPFEYNTLQGKLHEYSAGLAGAVFVVWMVSVRYLIPFFDITFYSFSAAMGASITAIYLLASWGIYFNTTGMELSVFAISTAWLNVFLVNMLNAALVNGHAEAEAQLRHDRS